MGLVGEQWLIRRHRYLGLIMAGCVQYFIYKLFYVRNGVWEGDELDLYYLIYMTVKFFFFYGWLRVAETLYNPFGGEVFKVTMH